MGKGDVVDLLCSLRGGFFDEKYFVLGLIDDACYGVALLESEGVDFVVEVLETVGPDATVGTDHITSMSKSLVVKSELFAGYNLFVADTKRNPLGGIGLDLVLEQGNL